MNTKIIGITGGVGAGKSEVLTILKELVSCRVIMADDLAKKMQEPGGKCHEAVTELTGKEVLDEKGFIDRKIMAEKIYADPNLREKINAVVHPAVTEEIKRIIKEEREAGKIPYLFIEAALLIENGYDRICDELWYVYAPEEVRRKRLKETRGYSDEKTDGILKAQLSDEEFRAACAEVIDNGGLRQDTVLRIEEILKKKGGI